MNNFHYISVLLDLKYGIELEDEDLEELGLLAWKKIGNQTVKLYRYRACIDPRDNSVTLPCNTLGNTGETVVEAVTLDFEDWDHVTNYSYNGNPNSSFIEENIEHGKYYTNPLYMSGKMVSYEQVKDKLYFPDNYGVVNILYKGILADEDGLPELTDEEASAIATFIAYILKFRESLATNNKDVLQQANNLFIMWTRECDQARITYLNQNDMNNIFQAKSSWDRPLYAKSNKPIR